MLSPENILKILRDECSYQDGDSIVVGVSGGADSIALLHLLHAAKVPVAAAHVNYGLRGEESDGDEKFVTDLCARLNVPLYVRKTDRTQLDLTANNLQNAARITRYAFFQEILQKERMRYVAIAHHEDDNLETMLINFLRGSGLRGMMGMSVLEESVVDILRPLLNFSRSDIEDYLRRNNLHWREDSSNESDDYLRNRLRKTVIPGLHAVDERDSKGWKLSMAQLKNSNTLLYSLASPFIEMLMTKQGMISRVEKAKVLGFAHPHVLFNWILNQKGFSLQFSQRQFHEFVQLQTGRKFFSHGVQLVVERDHWIFSEALSLDQADFTLHAGEEKGDWVCHESMPDSPEKYSGYNALIDSSKLTHHLVVRKWKSGDKLQPFGFNGTRKVSDILTEMKIPSDEKSNYPLVACQDEIVWIPGYRIAEKFKVTPETKTALHIQWNR